MNPTFSDPFKVEGRWFKGNLHTHTTVSDGVLSPEDLVEFYRKKGYDFLSITDHGILVEPKSVNHKGILLLPGEEFCVGSSQAGTTYHIVGFGVRSALPVRDQDPTESPQRTIDLINSYGGIAIIAHPYWSGLVHNDLLSLKDYLGIEIYNSGCDLYRNTGYSSPHIDALLAMGKRFLIFATDDHHGTPEPMKPWDAGIAWISVKARELTQESLMKAIRDGLFYSSNGPEIKDLRIEEGKIEVETSPVKSISFISTPSLGSKFTADSGYLTKYAYSGRLGERYIRIEATDEFGRTAWTNPLYLD